MKRVSSQDGQSADEQAPPTDIIKDGEIVAPGIEKVNALIVVVIVLSIILGLIVIALAIWYFFKDKIRARLGLAGREVDVKETKPSPGKVDSSKIGIEPQDNDSEKQKKGDDENQIAEVRAS